MFNKLAEKVTGKEIEDCVLRLHDARGNFHDLLNKVKAREAVISNPSYRDKDHILQGLYRDLNEARVSWASTEATLEKAKAEQTGLISLVNLLAASIQSGKETSDLEKAIATVIGQPEKQEDAAVQEETAEQAQTITASQEPIQQDAQTNQQSEDMESGEFKVLEVRDGKSQGTIRAYCEAPDGSKYAIFAKNGNGQKLAGAINKKVSVKYRRGDRGLIAFEVKVVA